MRSHVAAQVVFWNIFWGRGEIKDGEITITITIMRGNGGQSFNHGWTRINTDF
jgi:hypothetical protein